MSTSWDVSVLAFTCRTAGRVQGATAGKINPAGPMRHRKCAKKRLLAGLRQKARNIAALFDVEELDVEDQRGVRRNDAAGAAAAVAELGRNDQRALAADLHGRDAFVPAANDLADADLERERLIAIDRRVEFLALGGVLIKPPGVMHDAGLAGLRRGAGAGMGVDDFQSGGRGHDGLGSCGCENGGNDCRDSSDRSQRVATRENSHSVSPRSRPRHAGLLGLTARAMQGFACPAQSLTRGEICTTYMYYIWYIFDVEIQPPRRLSAATAPRCRTDEV